MVVHPTHTDIGVKVLIHKADMWMLGDQFGIQECWAEIFCLKHLVIIKNFIKNFLRWTNIFVMFNKTTHRRRKPTEADARKAMTSQ